MLLFKSELLGLNAANDTLPFEEVEQIYFYPASPWPRKAGRGINSTIQRRNDYPKRLTDDDFPVLLVVGDLVRRPANKINNLKMGKLHGSVFRIHLSSE